MNCFSYIARFLKSHGWYVVSDQFDIAPTTVTNSRTWDNWMEAKWLADLGKDPTDTKNTDVIHDAAASVSTTGLSSVNTSNSAPDLSNDELVALQLKDKNENNSEFTLVLKLPIGKVSKNNFEECKKSSKPIAPIPSSSIFRDKGAPEGTITHHVLETSSKFNYWNVFGELMYVYITCRPDILCQNSHQNRLLFIINFSRVWLSISAVQWLGVSVLINLPHLTLTNLQFNFLSWTC